MAGTFFMTHSEFLALNEKVINCLRIWASASIVVPAGIIVTGIGNPVTSRLNPGCTRLGVARHRMTLPVFAYGLHPGYPGKNLHASTIVIDIDIKLLANSIPEQFFWQFITMVNKNVAARNLQHGINRAAWRDYLFVQNGNIFTIAVINQTKDGFNPMLCSIRA